MKENYLWDKTGEDREIEGLENALKQFRSTNTTPPELPAPTFAFDNNSLQNVKPKRNFRFAFAAFACLGLMILSIGVFQILSIGNQELAQNKSERITEEPTTENSTVAESKPIVQETVKEKTEVRPEIVKKAKFTPKTSVTRNNLKTANRIGAKVKNRNPAVAKQIEKKPIVSEPKVKTVKLTKEEKEAYETLMQALAITGSQMRIVREKINGVEEKPVVK